MTREKQGLLFMGVLFLVFMAVTTITLHNMQAQKKGKRVDPFRCSDAKHYFEKQGIDVDCARIEKEVNS